VNSCKIKLIQFKLPAEAFILLLSSVRAMSSCGEEILMDNVEDHPTGTSTHSFYSALTD